MKIVVPNLNYIAPCFIVDDIKRSVMYYTNMLGFQILYMGPDGDPFWAMVGRDDISIMLKAITPDIHPLPNSTRHEWARWDAYIGVADPKVLFEEYRAAGVVFKQPLMVDGDGLLGFELTDADGYVLFFGRPNI